MTRRFPSLLLIAYLVLFSALAIDPYDRAVWFAENIPIVLIVVALVFSRRWFAFSNTAYLAQRTCLCLRQDRQPSEIMDQG